jgi:hypothetical protein
MTGWPMGSSPSSHGGDQQEQEHNACHNNDQCVASPPFPQRLRFQLSGIFKGYYWPGPGF